MTQDAVMWRLRLGGRGVYAITVTQAQAAAGDVLANGPKRLMGWSLAAGAAASYEDDANATTPAAGAVIASVAGLPAGWYRVNWYLGIGGTPAAADRDNLQLMNGAAIVMQSLNRGTAGEYPQLPVVIQVAAGGTVSVQVIGNATAGAVYTVQLTLDPIPSGVQAQLLDAGQTVGMSSVQSGDSDTQTMPEGGVYIGSSIAVKALSGAVSGCVWVRDVLREDEGAEQSQPRSSQQSR